MNRRNKDVKGTTPNRHDGYFEATIQLRNTGQEVVNYVFGRLESNDVRISKKEWYKHGIDLYVDNSGFARKLGRELQQKFGGMVKTSARIHTRDRMTQKDVYRVTVLFKQFYSEGEEFNFKGKRYTVVSVGKNVFAEDEHKIRKRFRFNELERARVF